MDYVARIIQYFGGTDDLSMTEHGWQWCSSVTTIIMTTRAIKQQQQQQITRSIMTTTTLGLGDVYQANTGGDP